MSCSVVMVTLSSFRSLASGGRTVDVEIPAGQVRWLHAQEHNAENVGDTRTHTVFVQLKEEAPARVAAARLGPAES